MASGVTEICRVCSEKRDISHSIWDWCRDRQVSELIWKILDIDVNSSDGLSQRICCLCLQVLEDANKLREVAQIHNKLPDQIQKEHTLISEAGSSEVNSNRSETEYFPYPISRTSYQTVNQTLPIIFQSPILAYQDHAPLFSPIAPYIQTPATIYYPLPTVQHQQRFVTDPIPISVPRATSNISQRQPALNQNTSKQDRQMNYQAKALIGDSEVESEYESIEAKDLDSLTNGNSEGSEYAEYPGSSFINGTDDDDTIEHQELPFIDLASEEYEKDGHPGSSYIDNDSEGSGQNDEADWQASRSVDSMELPHYQSFRSDVLMHRTSSYVYQDSDEAGTEDESDQEIAYIIEFK